MIHQLLRVALVIIITLLVVSVGGGAGTSAQDLPDQTTPADGHSPPPADQATTLPAENPKALALAESNITDQPAPAGSPEWLPGGAHGWTLEWSSEFIGPAGDENNPNVTKWYPMLGWTPEDFKANPHKGLRWTGDTAESSWFYSTKTGNHWLDGQGNLILRAVVDKTAAPNEHGPRVKTAYLQTGYPVAWNPEPAPGIKPDHEVRWAPGDGVFVSPTVDGQIQPLYISARLRADQVHGYSTWFAFWLFSQTRSYNNVPADGTEIDLVEVAAGRDPHFNNFFNVAHHWYPAGKVHEDQYFNQHTTPQASDFVNLRDGNYHTYGLEWSDQSMKCTIDGKLFYTFTENIPVEPIDMMLMLTLEFKPNLWQANAGDGRTEGPYVTDTDTLREMSRVQVDYVRVYRQQISQ